MNGRLLAKYLRGSVPVTMKVKTGLPRIQTFDLKTQVGLRLQQALTIKLKDFACKLFICIIAILKLICALQAWPKRFALFEFVDLYHREL